MTFLLGSHTFGFVWQGDAVKSTEQLAQAGFRTLELLAMPPYLDVNMDAGADDRAQVTALARAVERLGVDVLGIGLPSSDFNLASVDASVTAFTLEKYKQTIAVASELGSKRLVVIAGRKHALLPPPDDRLERILTASLTQLVRHAERYGVRVVLENHPGSLLPKAEQLRDYVTREFAGEVDVVYDVANGFAAGENPADGLRVLAPLLSHVHLSDSPAGGWRHDPIGMGGINFSQVRGALEGIECNVPVLLEILGPAPLEQTLASKAALEKQGWAFA